MKRLLWTTSFAICMALSVMVLPSQAAQAPVDAQGHALATLDWVGANTFNIDGTSGTPGGLISPGPGILYGVIISSIAPTNYLVFRDTNTANITSSTLTIVFANSNVSTAAVNSPTGSSETQFFKFPVPLIFNNGLYANASSTPTAGTGMWTILYRQRNKTGE